MRAKTKFLISLFILLLSKPLYSAPRTLLFLGDSLTAGHGLEESESYPSLIQEFIKSDQLDWKVINAGVSGDTTQGGLARLSWTLNSKPDLVFLALGANDGLRGVKVDAMRKNLEQIITQLQKNKIRVVLAGIDLPVNYGKAYRTHFKKTFSALAAQYHLSYYPFLLEGVALHPELNLADGLHPNAQGQKIMANKVYAFLKPFLVKY